MKKVFALGLAVVVLQATVVFAGGATRRFRGHGSVVDVAGKVLSEYDVALVQTEVSPGVKEQTISVKLPQSKTKEFRQRLEHTGNRFRIVSDAGIGGGINLGGGVLTTYMPGPEGAAFAQTIMLDADGGMRILRTELKNGEAVRFFRETYVAE